jgi:hypothetical protein
VGVPAEERHARVIARGKSRVTARLFNLTDEYGNRVGRAVAESSFHHFADYNWDIGKGCPSFVIEVPVFVIPLSKPKLIPGLPWTRILERR